MIRIPCPVCGLRDHSEFNYYRPADESPGLEAPQQDWVQHLFIRENARGPVREYWHHIQGCRLWLVVERDTLTHEVSSVEIAHRGAAGAVGERAGKEGGNGRGRKPATASRNARKTQNGKPRS